MSCVYRDSDTEQVKQMGSINGTLPLILVVMVMALNFTQLAGLPLLSTSSVSGRFLAETNNVSDSSRHLDDTVRVDPLDGLKKYRGGYDITNKHYWSSTVFTGIHGYAIAVLWLLCGLGYGGFLLVTRSCKSRRELKKRSPCLKQDCYLQPLLLVVVFTILAITASCVVLGGNAKFHSRAKTVIDIILDTADEASNTIYNTTGAMKEMSSTLGEVQGSSRATGFLISTSRTLDAQAADIARQASKNRRLIDKGLKIVYIVTTVMISLTLVAVIALLVSGILKFRRARQVLIVLGWILTALCWFFFGIYFFLQNFVGDTCTALESFQQNPYNNSLSSILPCDELLSAESVLDDVSVGIYDLVNEVRLLLRKNINVQFLDLNLSTKMIQFQTFFNYAAHSSFLHEKSLQVNGNISRSYGNIVQICNPFSPPPMYEYQPWNCPATSIRIGDIPQVLRLLACPDTEGQTCNGGILVPAGYYNSVEAYTTSIQKFLDVYPGMDSLVQCETVEDAFDEILDEHCSPLKRYVRMVWAALVALSVIMVALVIFWTVSGRHNENHHSFGSSVKPHFNTADMLESGSAKTSNDGSKPGLGL
ncbi:UNVERIFIED_CONTAM: hypothetical protein Sradi_2471300 [Sesamum radiatum]|uniref:Transmembrane protein n=1 Tax=Sesamum radiatum TaxID=300843 RepID=A0AAW2SJ19_SESRA